MNFHQFYSAIYSHHDYIISIWTRFHFISISVMCILYLCRAQNRRAIAKRFFGFKEMDPDRIIRERTPFKMKFVYSDVIYFGLPHLNWVLGWMYVLVFYPFINFKTAIWAVVLWLAVPFGVSMGSHRFYSHKSYKATRLYQIIIMLMHSFMMQSSIIHWVRDHRCHHKFVDTNADPYNAKRGLFFAHIGFRMTEKHPDVIKKGRTIDITDVTSNPILAFQRRYLFILEPLLHLIFPWLVPYLFWGEQFFIAYIICVDMPWVVTFAVTSSGNSWNHSPGDKPYIKNITATDGGLIRNICLYGEGYHNFHHAFPRDYRSNTRISDHGAFLVNLCRRYGITWDLVDTSPELIEKTKLRSAMGTENYDY